MTVKAEMRGGGSLFVDQAVCLAAHLCDLRLIPLTPVRMTSSESLLPQEEFSLDS